jgi:hypothetical protein
MQRPCGSPNVVERVETFEPLGVRGQHVFPVCGALVPLRYGANDRKLNVPGVLIRRFDSLEVTLCQLPRKMVKCAPQIMNGVSDDQADFFRHIFDALDAEYDSTPFSLEFLAEGKKFSFRFRLGNLSRGSFDMHFSPGQFSPSASEIERVSHTLGYVG